MTPRHRRAPLVAALGLAAVLALSGCGDGGSAATATSGSTGTAMSGTTARVGSDAEACAGFGDAGVEQRLMDVYDDGAASQELLDDYAAAPTFRAALQQTLELLRSSEGQLEGDFLAQACSP